MFPLTLFNVCVHCFILFRSEFVSLFIWLTNPNSFLLFFFFLRSDERKWILWCFQLVNNSFFYLFWTWVVIRQQLNSLFFNSSILYFPIFLEISSTNPFKWKAVIFFTISSVYIPSMYMTSLYIAHLHYSKQLRLFHFHTSFPHFQLIYSSFSHCEQIIFWCFFDEGKYINLLFS